MNYQETVAFLYSLLPVFQNEGKSALNYKLDKTLALLELLGNPHESFKTVHVAGTNGKGTTSHILASVLSEAGYKVGLYTSPHLKSFTERIKVNREEVSEQFVIEFVHQYGEVLRSLQPSFFEMTVVMAFYFFKQQNVDVAIVEVGLGGRFDSTNVITPDVSVITNISLDHQEFLGDTLGKIAFEKAGVIKKGVPVVIGEFNERTYPVFIEVAKNVESPLINAFDNSLPQQLLKSDDPNYVLLNKKTAYTAVESLKGNGYNISNHAIEKGFLDFPNLWGLKGRWQQIGESPKVICDTGHNEAGVKLLRERLDEYDSSNVHIVWGMASDKDVSEILRLLPQEAKYYFCQASIPRAMDAVDLLKKSKEFDLKGVAEPDVNNAISRAKKSALKDDLIIVGGSTFVVAEIENL